MEKIKKLRQIIKKNQIDGYIISKNDEFFGEYTPDDKDRLKFISNFSGSFGFALVLKNMNYLFYVTSNFRSLIQYNDNKLNMDLIEQKEALDNETALSDRFGIWLGFEKFNNNQYLKIVSYYCKKLNIKYDASIIEKKALQWSLNRGSKSGREAYFFVKSLHNEKI